MTSYAPRVGDDVVDLGDPETASGRQHPRFPARVCAPEELLRLGSGEAGRRQLWSYFAAKEAAFKALVRAAPALVFAHRRFLVSGDFTSVVHDKTRLSLSLRAEKDLVHAVCWGDCAAPLVAVSLREAAPQRSARGLLLMTLSHLPGTLTIAREKRLGAWSGEGPPVLFCDGAPLPHAISLSHHGRYVSCAAALAD